MKTQLYIVVVVFTLWGIYNSEYNSKHFIYYNDHGFI